MQEATHALLPCGHLPICDLTVADAGPVFSEDRLTLTEGRVRVAMACMVCRKTIPVSVVTDA